MHELATGDVNSEPSVKSPGKMNTKSDLSTQGSKTSGLLPFTVNSHYFTALYTGIIGTTQESKLQTFQNVLLDAIGSKDNFTSHFF